MTLKWYDTLIILIIDIKNNFISFPMRHIRKNLCISQYGLYINLNIPLYLVFFTPYYGSRTNNVLNDALDQPLLIFKAFLFPQILIFFLQYMYFSTMLLTKETLFMLLPPSFEGPSGFSCAIHKNKRTNKNFRLKSYFI